MDNRKVFNQVPVVKQQKKAKPQFVDATDQKKKVLQPLEEKNVMPRKQLTPLEKPDEADM